MAKEVVQNFKGLLTVYSDGSIHRPTDLNLPACPQPSHGVASTDVSIDPSNDIWARIFLPELPPQELPHPRLPLVLHFHGGGFCFGNPSTVLFHNFCSRMAAASRSIWVSVNYRLAPEHPLPAAYDDGYAALLWLRSQAQGHGGGGAAAAETAPWLAQHADFSKCFLAGESAGGTIVHFLAARAAGTDWSPVRLRGLLLIHSAFIDEKPEPKAEYDAKERDFFFRSCLPPGSPWGHPFLNPFHADSPKISEMELPPAFVAAAETDALRAGSLKYYEALKKAGKDVQLFESKDASHCFHLVERTQAAEALEKKMREFMESLL